MQTNQLKIQFMYTEKYTSKKIIADLNQIHSITIMRETDEKLTNNLYLISMFTINAKINIVHIFRRLLDLKNGY